MDVRRIILVFSLVLRLLKCSETEEQRGIRNLFAKTSGGEEEYRGVFNPRVEYDEWTPLGQGDPLKNDPTYDYVPPVLERVHYWVDPGKRTPDPPLMNSGVLVLGSSRTEQPVRTTESTLSSRFDTLSFLNPFLKFMDTSNLGLTLPTSTSSYHRPVTRTPPPVNYHKPPPPQVLQRPPYTVLMPPPPPPPPPAVTEGKTLATTLEFTTESQADTSQTLANNENLYKPVAISMPLDDYNATEVPEDGSAQLPIVTMFSNHKKQTQDSEGLEQPSEVMTPPPSKKADEYYVKKWNRTKQKTTTAKTTAISDTMTTDSMFKHYKQSNEPISGPFYLIIQGHSKVKTYGASQNQISANMNKRMDHEDRKGRRLRYGPEEVIQGHRTVDVETSYRTSEDDVNSEFTVVGEELEETFGKTDGGKSKKRHLTENPVGRFGRRLLSELDNNSTKEDVTDGIPVVTVVPPITSTIKIKTTTEDEVDIGLESLLALSEDYNVEEQIIQTVLRGDDVEGSGYGGVITSLLSRSVKNDKT